MQACPSAFGTDYPVEPVTPFRGTRRAVTRTDEAGKQTILPRRIRSTIWQAIAAYTQGSAYAEFAENWKGKLEPGYDADFIFWIATLRPFHARDSQNPRSSDHRWRQAGLFAHGAIAAGVSPI